MIYIFMSSQMMCLNGYNHTNIYIFLPLIYVVVT